MKHRILLILLLFNFAAFAQEDLLQQLDTVKPAEKQVEIAAFKALQIGNMQSTKLTAKGEWYVIISHRFGDLTQGFDNFFGLDDANTKLGAIYGITDWLSVAATRHTAGKVYELAVKYRFASQKIDGFPVTIVGYNTMDINSELDTDVYPNLKSSQRFAYSTQLLISRKVSEKLSFEVAPMFIYKNLYDPTIENQKQFVIGTGGRWKVAKRISINLEYGWQIDNPYCSITHNPLTAGIDIETGGHVFQLVFSNTQLMNDVGVFANPASKLDGGGIFFGFNMYRVF
ncbi:DUF5777 family beta-barrel protein [Flavobacterium silvaticum]|uniref:DUF5777 domain-containing protein n=1 Tax=Flavobacterium silvaticum TaxID=1852020 RepID=A0A972FNP9_9FLAO|nr:DUF5777 family beta-barrel protein [Flavobacterium silvaticum]NMH29409.1 hypothetical protein [Flavobacterium silvaticum]